MEDLKQIQEFFSKPLNEISKEDAWKKFQKEKSVTDKTIKAARKDFEKEWEAGKLNEGKQLDIVDLAKVVQAVHQTGHPVTVLLVPKFNEIEIITGMNAPDDMLRDLSNAVDSLGYGRNDIIIAGDSSNLSRREYSDIRRVNGGHKDYFEESLNEDKEKAIKYFQQAIKLSHTNKVRNLILKAVRELGLEVPKVWTESVIDEAKKLTYNDFVRMVRDDMMAGAAPDERPSEELVGKRAKAYYNDYLQGASVDDLFEENEANMEIKVGDYQTKYFYICPGAKSLYQDIEDKVEDMGLAIRAAKLQDALFAIEASALESGATEAEVFAAQSIADQIMAMAAMMGLDKEHSYIQGHVEKIKVVIG